MELFLFFFFLKDTDHRVIKILDVKSAEQNEKTEAKISEGILNA